MFDFNYLIDLYKSDVSKAREYLYDNVMVLCTKELLDGINERHHQDMVSDIYMKIDEWIQTSISKDFNTRQIYSYIKLRVSGFIINYFKFEIGKNEIETVYLGDDELSGEEYKIDDMMNLNNIPSLILDGLQKCSPLEMRFVLMHYYMSIPIKQIEKITGFTHANIYKHIKIGASRLKYFLENKGVNYEDLC